MPFARSNPQRTSASVSPGTTVSTTGWSSSTAGRYPLPADDAAGPVGAGRGLGRLRRALPGHHGDHGDVLLGPDDVVDPADVRREPAEAAFQLPVRRRAELDPGQLEDLRGREVGRERLRDVVTVEGRLEVLGEADDLVGHRGDDRLLAL